MSCVSGPTTALPTANASPLAAWEPIRSPGRQDGVVRRPIRALAVIGFALASLALAAAPAGASCIQQTQADQIARADVIAYGRVTSVDRGAGTLSFRAVAVYKGDPGPNGITVQIGPGPRGFGAATSVDYRADPGDHLLYLQSRASGYETSDCSGSHPGPPTAQELSLLSPSGAKVIMYADPGPDLADRLVAPAAAALAAAIVAAFVLYRRRRKSD